MHNKKPIDNFFQVCFATHLSLAVVVFVLQSLFIFIFLWQRSLSKGGFLFCVVARVLLFSN